MTTPLALTLTRTGNQLHVAYRYENTTDHVQYIADGIVAQISNDTFVRAVATDYAPRDKDTLAFYIGTPAPSGVPDAAPPQAAYVPVAAKSKYEGKRDVQLPFTQRDPMSGEEKPLGDFKQATLNVLLYDGEPTWRDVKAKDGGTIKVSTQPATTTLTSDVVAIPTK